VSNNRPPLSHTRAVNMQLINRLLYFHLLLVGVTSNALPAAISMSETNSIECRCVPDQWEGIMTTSEHEVDIYEGRHREIRSTIVVHYDYIFKRLATDDVDRGVRSIADYAQVTVMLFSSV